MSEQPAAPAVVVVDAQAGNLGSVAKSLRALGAAVTVTSEPARVAAAPRVVFPGVGAFARTAGILEQTGLDAALREAVARGAPLLGICLGMQLLFEQSEEFGTSRGLGLLPGAVVRLPGTVKVPHMGWNGLRHIRDHPIVADVPPLAHAYFCHSYHAEVGDQRHLVSVADYGPVQVASVVAHERIVGTQFHPEKSQAVGLHILKAFLAAEPAAAEGAPSP